MKKKLLAIISLFLLLMFLAKTVYAKRILPRAQSSKGTVATKTKGVTTSVKFRPDRLAIIVSLNNLSIASKVDYVLSYYTRGTTQGASGAISIASDETITRELLFGTCSHGVCRYDTGISNARLVITTKLSSGRKVIKSYRLKV